MAATGVAIKNLGCRVNRVEVDAIASALEDLGVAIVSEEDAAAIVINTCIVTGEAEAKTRKAVRHAASREGSPLVIACGCAANLFSEELSALAPNVVVEKDKSLVAKIAADEFFSRGGVAQALEAADRTPTPTGRSRAGIKVQDGCNRRCSFCIVWKARGASASKPIDEVMAEVDAACERGSREIVLTGINVGSYEHEGIRLPQLIERVLERPQVGRVRIASIEPEDVTDELIDVMAAHGERVAPFLHICLQSGCDETLARMRRGYTSQEFAERVGAAREKISGLMLGTDVIVGFPGETDEEFAQSLAFCERMGFSRMHIFRYSKRTGTPAAQMEGQVDPKVMAARADAMHDLAERMRAECAASLAGTVQLVAVQDRVHGVTGGLFDVVFDEPCEADALVHARVSEADAHGLLHAQAKEPV